MSNSIGAHTLLKQRTLPLVFLERHTNSGSPDFHPFSFHRNTVLNRAQSPLRTEFLGKSFNWRTARGTVQVHRSRSVFPQAAVTMDPTSDVVEKFILEGDIELKVNVNAPIPGSVRQVDIQIAYSSDSLLLHWGGIRDVREKWALPSNAPEGSINYKNRALRTPFLKSGTSSYLKLEIVDSSIQAVEFLIYDEAGNKWFKDSGKNFHIKLPTGKGTENSISVPEELVQVYAYLRWERKGKQMYTPDQEKEEYEAARMELMKEMTKGASVEDLRNRLSKTTGVYETKENNFQEEKVKEKVPDDLVQIQAYIRWEKAGKPVYSPEKQIVEFEEARQELQSELQSGVSLADIRKKILKGEIQTKVSKQLRHKNYFSPERIQRKKRDFLQMLNKYVVASIDAKTSVEPKRLTALELYAKAKEEQSQYQILNKKVFNIGDNMLIALVTNSAGKKKIHLATDIEEPIILHWALSEVPDEWLAPPSSIVPAGSASESNAVETQLTLNSSSGSQVQTFELEIEDEIYKGMPFVLRRGEEWIKSSGRDFYVEFSQEQKKTIGDGKGTAKTLLDKISGLESEAQKSFMHRFNIASDLVNEAKHAGELGFVGILVWMRFMATRQLVWNKNYNVKPREISKSQDGLTELLQNIYVAHPQYREIVRMIMSTVGRGGEGDVGQRIRDEILVIQRNNNCKGGMMEEWHQKLHNNTSPDDIVICQALIDYIESDFDVSVYWKTLSDNGITKERLLSYDRPIHSVPDFKSDQKDGLIRDLGHYMRTLKAVHSGADLESAISNCLGYKSEGQGFMVGVQINPVSGLPSGFTELLRFVCENVENRDVEPLLEGLLEARQELCPLLSKSHDRLKDLLFLDIALDSTVRTAVERGYEELKNAGPEKIMHFISLVLENLALSSDDNEDLIYCLKEWDRALNELKNKTSDWALYAKSVLDRTRLVLSKKAEHYHQLLQPSAEYLGSQLGVDQWAIDIFTEEMIRAGSAASLSALVNRLDPVLRKVAHLGSWQIISPIETVGYVTVVDELLAVQNRSFEQPTILVANSVKGEEEIPDGAVAVLTPDMPDVLSHVSVRARNGKVCFATCFDHVVLSDLQSKDGKLLSLKPTSADIVYREVSEDDLLKSTSTQSIHDDPPLALSLIKKEFSGRYAITSEEFTSDRVGAKSRNIGYLKGKVPSWIGIPTSVALPFGVFEKVLSGSENQEVAEKLQALKKMVGDGDQGVLRDIRGTVLQLVAPPELIQELKTTMQSCGMPWPGDEGDERWEQAWMAIKKVWASKWNERAYFSTRKAKLDHEYLCMAVLVQEIISADYAFVIHTTNPSSGDSSEIYAEVVKGLGETLVGAYPGRALSFICKKDRLDLPKVLGYPSKPIGLFIRRSIIFRSDSNGEDLEGYAGAGLYDSVPMDREEKVVLDYTSDPLITDQNFRQSMLSGIAEAGNCIEKLYGSPQDIEGVVRDGKIYVVQTRPQM